MQRHVSAACGEIHSRIDRPNTWHFFLPAPLLPPDLQPPTLPFLPVCLCARPSADELVFEVNAPDAVMGPDGSLQHPGQQFVRVAAAVKQVMEGAAPMSVPLRAKLAWGTSWGSLADLQL